MAGDWMKFEKATLDKPEVFEMAGILEIDPDAVIGKLLRVWDWFDDQSIDGYAPVTLAAQLNRNTGCAGFTKAMEKVGWLVIENDRLKIPNFTRHNGQTAKDRALSSKRMAKHRGRCYGDSVTSTATKTQPEKRREEKSIIPPNPQGGLELEIQESKPSDPMPKGWQKMNAAQRKIARVNFNTPAMIEFGKIMGRGDETLWTVAEAAALMSVKPTQDEIKIARKYYHADIEKQSDFRRRDIITLLNNWNGEVDRARIFSITKP